MGVDEVQELAVELLTPRAQVLAQVFQRLVAVAQGAQVGGWVEVRFEEVVAGKRGREGEVVCIVAVGGARVGAKLGNISAR